MAAARVPSKSDLEVINIAEAHVTIIISTLEDLATRVGEFDIENISRLTRQLTELGDEEVSGQLGEEVALEVKRLATIAQEMRSLHSKKAGGSRNRLGNLITKHFTTNFDDTLNLMGIDSKVFMEPEKKKVMSKAIYENFLREGKFAAAESFKTEAGEVLDDNNDPAIRMVLIQMYAAFDAFNNKDIGPSMNLISDYSHKFEAALSPLPFVIHKLAFMELVKSGKNLEAVQFAQANFKPGLYGTLDEVQHLFGTLMLTPAAGYNRLESKYAVYFDDSLWENGRKMFIEEALYAFGACRQSPFPTVFEAGMEALTEVTSNPTLYAALKNNWTRLQRDILRNCHCNCSYCQTGSCGDVHIQPQEWGPSICTDPMFHSVFVCPITREQIQDPLCDAAAGCRYPCGHVISRDACMEIQRRTPIQMFKCPICHQNFGSPVDIDNPNWVYPIRPVIFL